MRPVVSLYSTFLQRAYDQLVHDVCINNMPVILAVDRSGIVGRDGETHQGIFDISYLGTMPNMTILSPMDGEELVSALDFALTEMETPVAVRYPRGEALLPGKKGVTDREEWEYGRAEVLQKGKDVLILAVGNMVEKALEAAGYLKEKAIHPTIVNMRFVKPFDTELVLALAKKHRLVVTMEDNVYSGGFSEKIQAFLQAQRMNRVKCLAVCLPDTFIEHGAPEELYEKYGMDAESVAGKIREVMAG